MSEQRFLKLHERGLVKLSEAEQQALLYSEMVHRFDSRTIPSDVEKHRIPGTLTGISRQRQMDERAGRYIMRFEMKEWERLYNPQYDLLNLEKSGYQHHIFAVSVPVYNTFVVGAHVVETHKDSNHSTIVSINDRAHRRLARLFFQRQAGAVDDLQMMSLAGTGLYIRDTAMTAIRQVGFKQSVTKVLGIKHEIFGCMIPYVSGIPLDKPWWPDDDGLELMRTASPGIRLLDSDGRSGI